MADIRTASPHSDIARPHNQTIYPQRRPPQIRQIDSSQFGDLSVTKSMAAAPDVFLIQPTLRAADFREKLMGALVSRPSNPSWAYEPKNPIAIKAVPGMDPKPIPIRDIEQIVNTTSSGQFQAKLQGLINGYLGKDESSSTENKAKLAVRYFMDRPPEQLRALLNNKDIFKKVLEMYKAEKTTTLYFVAHIVTFANWNVKKSDKAGTDLGIDANLHEPSTQLGVRVGGSHIALGETTTTGEYEDEMIFCVGYHIVELVEKKGLMAFFKRLGQSSKRAGYVLTPYEMNHADLTLDPIPAPGDGHLGMGRATGGENLADGPDEMVATIAAEKVKEVGFQIYEFPQPIPPPA